MYIVKYSTPVNMVETHCECVLRQMNPCRVFRKINSITYKGWRPGIIVCRELRLWRILVSANKMLHFAAYLAHAWFKKLAVGWFRIAEHDGPRSLFIPPWQVDRGRHLTFISTILRWAIQVPHRHLLYILQEQGRQLNRNSNYDILLYYFNIICWISAKLTW